MTHLLAALLRYHDPGMAALVVLDALLGGAALRLLPRPRIGYLGLVMDALAFGCIVTLVSWLAFMTALAGTYPKLSLSVPLRWMVPALMISLLSATVAGAIHRHGRRSARNSLLAGSLRACGFSCMLFTAMAGLVEPFALTYDLTAMLVVMVLGATLSGFALWESSNSDRRHRPWVIGNGLTTLAVGVLSFGSLAAILPFPDWVTAVNQPDQLASSPIVIIIAAEAVAVLVLSLSGSLVDNRVAARDLLEMDRFKQLANSTLEGILIHRDGRILDGNESIASMLGLPLLELRASSLARFVVPESDSSAWNPDRGQIRAETEVLAANGGRVAVEILSRAINYGGRAAVVTALRDVRERHQSDRRIHFLAHHDMLTALPNRVLLAETLELALLESACNGAPVALFVLDLDSFKMVNDTLGHAAGDQLLCQVAVRLRANMGTDDFLARVGGDEFVVLQVKGVQPEQATLLAQRLIASLAPPFYIDGQELTIGVSIGIAICPQDGDTADLLSKNADIALYRAKEHGLGWFQLFESSMALKLNEQRMLAQDLRTALLRDEFTLHFQPMFDSQLDLVAFEALIRWMHPSLGLVSPGVFIPIAESSGLIIPLGEWVMRTACKAAMHWSFSCRVAVNLSPAQFRHSDLRATVAAILAESGLPPGRLELEITEGVLVDNTQDASRTFADLRELGVRLVLDDFGTGYSSLSYLQRFPFDKLKIDRSFVQKMEADEGSLAIVKAIIAMSHSLNLEVTAEGVETIEQFELLCVQGCHELQGFLLGHPIPQETVDHFTCRYLLARVAPNVPRHLALKRLLRIPALEVSHQPPSALTLS